MLDKKRPTDRVTLVERLYDTSSVGVLQVGFQVTYQLEPNGSASLGHLICSFKYPKLCPRVPF